MLSVRGHTIRPFQSHICRGPAGRGRWTCSWPPAPRHLVNDTAPLHMRNSLPEIPTPSRSSTNGVPIWRQIKLGRRGGELKAAFPSRAAAGSMPRSFLVKSKRAHSYHQPRGLDDDHSRLDVILAHACAGGSIGAQVYARGSVQDARPGLKKQQQHHFYYRRFNDILLSSQRANPRWTLRPTWSRKRT